MSDDERGVQTGPQANRVSGVVDSQDETSVAPDSLSELPPSARNLRRLENWDGGSVPPGDEASVEALIAEAQRLGLEVRNPQKGNRRGKFTRVSGKEERYRVTAYLDRPTREALHMAEFHCRMTATGMLEEATVEYLERRGFKVR